ncbi:FPR4, partial [Symbiodinium necroappetens]
MASAKSGNRFAALGSEDECEEPDSKTDAKTDVLAKRPPKRRAKRKRSKVESGEGAGVDPAHSDTRLPKRKRKKEKRLGTGDVAAAASHGHGDGHGPACEAKEPAKEPQVEGLLPTGTTKTLQGGVTIKVLRAAPKGAPLATKGCEVKLMYEGRLPDKNGRRFDVGEIDFLLGDGTMLPGFAIGVAGMGVGERRLIRVPWRLGYGKKGKRPKIPPKSDLDFDASLTFCGIDWKRRVSSGDVEQTTRGCEEARQEAEVRPGYHLDKKTLTHPDYGLSEAGTVGGSSPANSAWRDDRKNATLLPPRKLPADSRYAELINSRQKTLGSLDLAAQACCRASEAWKAMGCLLLTFMPPEVLQSLLFARGKSFRMGEAQMRRAGRLVSKGARLLLPRGLASALRLPDLYVFTVPERAARLMSVVTGEGQRGLDVWCGDLSPALRGFVALGVPIGHPGFVKAHAAEEVEALAGFSKRLALVAFRA